ncbi:MAG: transcription antitermination factor NusB [Clostridia bacterium]|nr:transcription antitermination factor NusB [Anaerotignum sp.]NCC15404.1 transcription antitermination factor NusB [Clostridia bacterium]
MSRRSARKNAFFLLFQMDFNKTEEYEQVKEIFFAEQDEPVEEEDKQFIVSKVEGTRSHMDEIDIIIGDSAKGWNTDRMSKVDLAILRLAVYELKFSGDTPVGVAINEAVELAKKFSSDEAPGFINGILGKVAAQ